MLNQLKDIMANSLYGMSVKEALDKLICIDCKKPITEDSFYSVAGRNEYFITGMCEYCYDKIFEKEE